VIRSILPIVEGKAEVEGVPVLLRRLLSRIERNDVQVARPFWVKRTQMVRPGEIERAILLGPQDRTGVIAVVVILDADDDDPSQLEASLAARCRTASDLPVAVVAARRELESWFLGCKDSLRGVCGIRSNANPPENPEAIRGAKERLSQNMEGKRHYEVDDLPALAAHMDLNLAMERCLSFRRLVSELARILGEAGERIL
jgi:hypothetical protein